MIYQLVHTDSSVVMTRFAGMMSANQFYVSASSSHLVCRT